MLIFTKTVKRSKKEYLIKGRITQKSALSEQHNQGGSASRIEQRQNGRCGRFSCSTMDNHFISTATTDRQYLGLLDAIIRSSRMFTRLLFTYKNH